VLLHTPTMRTVPWTRPSDKAYTLTWMSWAALLCSEILDAWVHQVPPIIWVGKVLPLLIFLPGMVKNNLRSYIWLCFVSLLYFIALVERLVARPENTVAAVGLLAVVTLFIAAMLFVRWRAREIKAAAEAGESE